MRKLLVWAGMIVCFCLSCTAWGDAAVIAPAYPVPQHVEWLLEVARGEIGYTENRNGYTKYGEWAGDPYAEWCAEFLCWSVSQVDALHGTNLLERVYPRYSGMNTGMRWFLRQGRFIARSGHVNDWGSQWYIGEEETMPAASYVPQPGDWVFYTVDGINTSHVALVEGCTLENDGGITVHVIEGNMPDCVQRSTHDIEDKRVMGYGTVYELADIVLRSGCEGVKVTALQEKLHYLGYLDAQYVTGVYGPSTTQAVSHFQEDTDKVPTGIANHHTQLTLAEMYHDAYWSDDANFQVVE